jgi:putative membrane protein
MSSPVSAARPSDDRAFYAFNAAVSGVALAVLTYLLVIRRSGGAPTVDLRFMPAVNASLNALSATFLVAAYVAIRKQKRRLHMAMNLSALAASTLFLLGYLTYHYWYGDTRYQGVGAMRAVYFSVLISHILLSTAVIPLALTSLYLSAKKSFARHRKVSRITLPVWLYVSVTGVVIYFMLRA